MPARCSMMIRPSEHGRERPKRMEQCRGLAWEGSGVSRDASGAVARAGVKAYAIRHSNVGLGNMGESEGLRAS
jgi:hypothetical protein